MPGMFGASGMNAPQVAALANQEAALNRNNTYSPIYGGTQWSYGPAGGGGSTGGGSGNTPGTLGDGTQYTGGGILGQVTGENQPAIGSGGGGQGMWTETQTLSPFMQQRFDLAQNLMGRVGSEMQPLSQGTLSAIQLDPNFESTQQQAAYNYAKGQMDPQWAQQQAQLQSQMAAQGLHPGDPAYNQQMSLFQNQKANAYNQAANSSYQTGVQAGQTRMQTATQALQDQLQASGWTLGQINALMAGLPQAPGGNGPQSNLLQAGMQNSQLQQQLANQGANNLIGSGATLAAAAISDVNAKEDFSDAGPAIEEFLSSAEPSEYSYKSEYQPLTGEGRHVSPMAQGLERSSIGRSMVVETPVGKVVDYGKSFGALLGSLSHINRKLNGIMGL